MNTYVERQSRRDMLERLPAALIGVDAAFKISHWNRAAEEIFGFSADSAIGENPCELIVPPHARPDVSQVWLRLSRSDANLHNVQQNLTHDGRIITCEWHSSPVRDENGTFVGVLAIVHDITDRVQAQKKLGLAELRLSLIGKTRCWGAWTCEFASDRLEVTSGMGPVFGLAPGEGLRTMEEIQTRVHPEDRRILKQAMIDNREKGESPSIQYRVIWPDQSVHWVAAHTSVMYSATGKPEYSVGVAFDITQQKEMEESMRIAAMVYQHSSEAITVTDARGVIISVNPAFTVATGYSEQEAIGQTHRLLSSGRQQPQFYREMWHAIHTTGAWQGEIWNRRKNGEVYAEWLTINSVHNDDGSVHRYIGMFSDITKKKQSDDLIWRQANFDALTGLPNRHMFRQRLEQEMTIANRNGSGLVLMFLDLDHFKEVNDTLGHEIGDLLLKTAANRLRNCVRGPDLVARLGGDEFTIILTDPESAGRVADSILGRLSEPYQLKENKVYLSVSIGMTRYPDDAADVDTLLRNADQAMYAAKSGGRNRCSDFTPSMQDVALTRLHMTNDLREALAAGQLVVCYQPIVELATGVIRKAEALVRWRHPVRGLISPDEFIPLAEETGLIIGIGDWVFRESAREAKHLRGSYHPEFQISVNKSPVQFQDDGPLFKEWFDYLKELDLPGQSVVIEITEGLLMNISARIKEKLLALRDAGVQVSLDDFGTGYSSLSYLKKFDIDYLKIDRFFVMNLATDRDDLALCEAIIVMAHKLGLKVIAEGVETDAQRDLLAAMGCDYGQGYLFSKPLPGPEFEAMLAAATDACRLAPA